MWLEGVKWFSEARKLDTGTHYSKPRTKNLSEEQIKDEMVRRTPRKFAIQIPPKIAHRFAGDISNGPSFFSFLSSSKFWTFAWCCEGVARSVSLSEDMVVWEQVEIPLEFSAS